MTLRLIGNKYNCISPGKISITYFYPEEHSNKQYESYDASSILEFLEYIENDGGRVIEFSIDPEPIPEDCFYTGWCSFIKLVNNLYEKHFIDTIYVSYVKSLVPDSYKGYININDV